jgi:hypothetical protein
MKRGVKTVLATPVVGLVAGLAGYMALLRPWADHFGAIDSDISRSMPGDDVITRPSSCSTRATIIEAPVDAIWPWLVQMGQNRAGFYSYDRLERLAGAGIHNANRIVPEWQHLATGDLMQTYRDRKGREPLGWIVIQVEPNKSLVVRSRGSDWTWSILLEPVDAQRTKIIARTRTDWTNHPLWMAPLDIAGEPAHFVMELGVLRGVKRRAESLSSSSAPRATRMGTTHHRQKGCCPSGGPFTVHAPLPHRAGGH